MPQNSSTSIEKIVLDGENISISTDGIEVIEGDEIKILAGLSNIAGVVINLSVTNVTENYNVTMSVFSPAIPTFSTAYGLIDVIWLGKDNQKINTPLVELPSGLTPIKLNSDGTYAENPTGTWYDYAEKTATVTSQWANAINPDDGSFFVWIPRYAYRITYYDTDPTDVNSGAKVTGYYDGDGMWTTGENDKIVLYQKLEDGINTVTDGNKKYIVHPAFEKNADLGGGFSTDSNQIAGIWVAKYEMSMENYNSTTAKWEANGTTNNGGGDMEITKDNKDEIRAVSKPSTSTVTVSSWRSGKIARCYKNSYNYNRNLKSHLTKNSEWGAVAYLTHSQYGRNGEEIAINDSSSYLTGTGGVNASSTGNITGIYDLSGGAGEYIAAYNNKQGSNNFITKSGWEIDLITGSTEYSTKYINDIIPITSTGRNIYIVGKTGDATKEVFDGSWKSWFYDNSYFVSADSPFFIRGGYWSNNASSGVFSSDVNGGGAAERYSFRVVLVP